MTPSLGTPIPHPVGRPMGFSTPVGCKPHDGGDAGATHSGEGMQKRQPCVTGRGDEAVAMLGCEDTYGLSVLHGMAELVTRGEVAKGSHVCGQLS